MLKDFLAIVGALVAAAAYVLSFAVALHWLHWRMSGSARRLAVAGALTLWLTGAMVSFWFILTVGL